MIERAASAGLSATWSPSATRSRSDESDPRPSLDATDQPVVDRGGSEVFRHSPEVVLGDRGQQTRRSSAGREQASRTRARCPDRACSGQRRNGGYARHRQSRRQRGQARGHPARRAVRGVERQPYAGGAGHLESMPEEAEAGHVGGRHDRVRHEHLGRGPVKGAHPLDRGRQVGRIRPPCREPLTSRPVPSRFVSSRASPGSGAALPQQAVGMARPDDREPVLRLGVADRVAAGERATRRSDLSDAPPNTSAMVSRGSSSGNAAIDSANRTRPPIAKTSLTAFAAAISPNVRASSTSGGKKSSVPMIARSSLTRYAAASSGGLGPRSARRRRGLGAEPGERIRQQIRAKLRRAATAIGQLVRRRAGCRKALMVDDRRARASGPRSRPTHYHRVGSGRVPVGPLVFKTSDAALGVAWWVRLPRVPARRIDVVEAGRPPHPPSVETYQGIAAAPRGRLGEADESGASSPSPARRRRGTRPSGAGEPPRSIEAMADVAEELLVCTRAERASPAGDQRDRRHRPHQPRAGAVAATSRSRPWGCAAG